MNLAKTHQKIVLTLENAGKDTPYTADANETDPRYLGYGVRAPQMKQLIAQWLPDFQQLDNQSRVALAQKLIDSGYGEQKTVALSLLNLSIDYFTPEQFELVVEFIGKQQGWSTSDAYAGSFLKSLLDLYPEKILALTKAWSTDAELWLRRASVVVFTRHVARSGIYIDHALELCELLKHDREDLVQKGVGWCLKDHLRFDKPRIKDYVVKLRQQSVPATITSYALRDLAKAERQAIISRGKL